MVGYNVQTAVDEKHHLIAAHEVTNDTTDRRQLEDMAQQARKALKTRTLTVVADAGYYEGEAIAEHPYSAIKQSMGMTHFLTSRLPGVKAEMSLHVLAYNMKRAINVLGTTKIMNALQPE